MLRKQTIGIFVTLWFISWTIFLAGPSLSQAQEVIVIEGGTLIDGNGGAPVPDSLIIIRGNRIETVSSSGQASYPPGATVLRADGKFILPGLMDAHVHYQGWMAELLLAHGVTSIFSIGRGGQWDLAQRKAIEHGKAPGPRMFVAVGNVAAAWKPDLARVTGTDQVIDTVEEATETVRRYVKAGADMIAIRRGVSAEIYKAAIDEAHQAGLPVVAQPIGPTVYAKEAVLAGADILEHSSGVGYSLVKDPAQWKDYGRIEIHSLDPTPYVDMDEAKAAELIRLMVDRNVYLEPDLIAVGRGVHDNRLKFELQDSRILQHPGLAYIPRNRRQRELGVYKEFDELEPADWQRRHAGYKNMLRFTREFVQAGGKVMTGTDSSSWVVPGLGLHHEMEILAKEAGLTPMQTILAATRNPAEGFRILDEVGTIETGKLADFVIVNEDPLQDINNLQKIEWVIKDGKLIDRTYHPDFRNPIPSGTLEARNWVAALKQITLRGIRSSSGLTDPTWSFGQPSPGIESLSPSMVTEGDPTLTLAIRGVNFTSKSLAYFDGMQVPTRLVSETELAVTIEASFLTRVGNYPIEVRNPEPLQQPKWGGTSNRAHLLVNFRY